MAHEMSKLFHFYFHGALTTTHFNSRHLNIYSLCLTKDTNGHAQNPASLELRHSVSKPLARGAFFDVHVCGHIVAAAVARFSDPTSPPSYDVILVNVLTHTQWLFHPDFPLVRESHDCTIRVS